MLDYDLVCALVVRVAATSKLLSCRDNGLNLTLFPSQHARIICRDHVRVSLSTIHLR